MHGAGGAHAHAEAQTLGMTFVNSWDAPTLKL